MDKIWEIEEELGRGVLGRDVCYSTFSMEWVKKKCSVSYPWIETGREGSPVRKGGAEK